MGRDMSGFFDAIKSGGSRPEILVRLIKGLSGEELVQLRELLETEWGEGGDEAGVVAKLPPRPPSREGGAEAELLFPDEGLPEDYWETAT